MKGLKFYDKFMFFLNIIVAIALLIAYVLPFIPPRVFPTISVLSLAIGPLLIANALFFLYWLFKVRRQMFLSLLILLVGFVNLSSFYKFTESKDVKNTDNSVSIMTYNVKSFNKYKWIDKEGIKDSIINFIAKQKPQILNLQEYNTRNDSEILSLYKYHYIQTAAPNTTFGQAILSQFEIVNKGSLDYEDTGNNAIYADLKIGADTLRVYNVHLQSHRVNPNVEDLQNEGGKSVLKRLGSSFKMQQDQVAQLKTSLESKQYKTIICTDMNNSAFSYVYRSLKGNRFRDAFKAAGNGFGRSFDSNIFPLRIDFIFVDKQIDITGFKTYENKFSDHFPLKASIKL